MKPCPVDGTPVPISLKQGRPATYCSSACRVKAYRQRKAQELVAPARRAAAPAAPRASAPEASTAIPYRMRQADRWVRWDVLRGRKMPLQTRRPRAASVADSRTWGSYADAQASTVGRGVGYVLGGGVGCLDLDHCIAPDCTLSALAQQVLTLNPHAWVEVSMSGTGLHVFGLLDEAPGRRTPQLEVYSRGRYIAMTGTVHQPGGLHPLVLP